MSSDKKWPFWARLAIICIPLAAADAWADQIVPPFGAAIGFCLMNPAMCAESEPSSAPLSLTPSIIRINREVNESLRNAPDIRVNVRGEVEPADNWSFAPPGGIGDCEDYVNTKWFRLMWELRIEPGAFRRAIVRRMSSDTKHLVLVIKIGLVWFILDNATSLVVPLDDTDYEVLSITKTGDPRTWVKP